MPDNNITLEDFVQQKLKIDESEDIFTLALLIDGAKEYLKESGVVPEDENNPSSLYKIAVGIHALLNYENYDSSLNVEALNRSLTSIILKIRG